MENFETGTVIDCEADDCKILSELAKCFKDDMRKAPLEAFLRIKYRESSTKRKSVDDRAEYEQRQRESKKRRQLMAEIIRNNQVRRDRENASFNACMRSV